MKEIPMENKKIRNIKIGVLQNKVPLLKPYLKGMVENVIDYYLYTNGLTMDDIIVRQKDGIISKKVIEKRSKSLNLEYREHILKCIISSNRKTYLKILSDGRVECLGVPNKPMNLSFLNLFRNLNFSNKKLLVNGLEEMRHVILTSTKKSWFVKEVDETTVSIPLTGNRQITLGKLSLSQIESDEIDKSLIWDNIVWPFAESILLYC